MGRKPMMLSRPPRRLALWAALPFLFAALAAPPSFAAIRYVNKNVTAAAPDGTTWATAFPTVQAALLHPAPGDEVWVAAGDYVQTTSLIMPFGMALYGGFLGYETQRDQRNPHDRPTILDGAPQNRVNIVTFNAGIGPDTVLDGFVIRNGYNGGINCLQASPTIAHNLITGNRAGQFGGGIYVYNGSNAAIMDNVITANGAALYGGGIYCVLSSPTITNNTIVGNGATSGGGLYVLSGAPVVANNIIACGFTGVYYTPPSGDFFRNNDVYGNYAYNYTAIKGGPGVDSTGKNGDIQMDPLFASRAYGDFHIQAGSPCINAGDDTLATLGDVDIDGEPRIQGAHADIGADESDGRTTVVMPRVFLVSPTGDDTNDGRTWARAKKTVTAGVAAAAVNGGEVWVAAGTYPERLTLPPYVYLYGGFGGTETSRDQRDWNKNVAVLDGNGIPNTDAFMVVTVLNGHGVSAVDGFFIQNGRANSSRPAGGGVSIQNASPAVANNVVIRCVNTGVYCDTGAPLITNNAILLNVQGQQGGGILCYNSAAVITNNEITGNSAQNGGGIGVFTSPSVTIKNNLVNANTNTGTTAQYAAIYSDTSSYVALLNNTIISNNSAALSLSAVSNVVMPPLVVNNVIAFNSGGASIKITATSKPTIRNNCVYSNGPLDTALGSPDQIGKNGNIRAYPVFEDIGGGDFRLSSFSPCLDAGDDSVVGAGDTDLDGHPRILGKHVDIGAYERAGIGGTVNVYNAIRALRIAGGLDPANTSDSPLNVETGDLRITLSDALRLLRRSSGLDPAGM